MIDVTFQSTELDYELLRDAVVLIALGEKLQPPRPAELSREVGAPSGAGGLRTLSSQPQGVKACASDQATRRRRSEVYPSGYQKKRALSVHPDTRTLQFVRYLVDFYQALSSRQRCQSRQESEDRGLHDRVALLSLELFRRHQSQVPDEPGATAVKASSTCVTHLA